MEAGTAALACTAIAAFTFQLIILDEDLPDGTGLSVCQQAITLRPGVPVVFVTGTFYPELLEQSLRRQGLRKHVLDFWIKPINPDRVRRCLNVVFPDTGPKSPPLP